MREIIFKVPRGYGKQVLQLTHQQKYANLALTEAEDLSMQWDLVTVYVENNQVGSLIASVDHLPSVQVTVKPQPVIPMSPPAHQIDKQITQVQPRSPMEIWLNSLQSIGSWKSFLGYSVAASVVVWTGMFTNTSFLLIAAMLIAPFAGPAMNVAIATATGHKRLLGRNIFRYFAALSMTILVTGGISLALQLETATSTMVNISEISSVAVFLPLIAGAAGALNLVESENNSLVSGTAVGLLVAASLTPPAGMIGMAASIGRWDMAVNGLFVLGLQLAGINLAGALVFRTYGLNTKGARFKMGSSRVYYVSLAVTSVILGGLLFVQFYSSPNLERSTQAQHAVGTVQKIVDSSNVATLVEANMRFTRPSVQNSRETLLGIIYVQPKSDVVLPKELIQEQVTQEIQQGLLDAGYNVTPLIGVTVLEAP